MRPQTIGQAIRAGALVITGMVLPVAVGAIFNWGFILFLVLDALTNGLPQQALFFWAAIPVFGLLFPLFYFWLGRGLALRKGLLFAFEHAEGLLAHVAELAVGYLIGLHNPQHLSTTAVLQLGEWVQKAFEKMPPGLRRLVAFLVERLPFAVWYTEIRSRLVFSEDNRSELSSEMKTRINAYIRSELAPSGFPWIWAVAGLNLAAVTAFYLLVL